MFLSRKINSRWFHSLRAKIRSGNTHFTHHTSTLESRRSTQIPKTARLARDKTRRGRTITLQVNLTRSLFFLARHDRVRVSSVAHCCNTCITNIAYRTNSASSGSTPTLIAGCSLNDLRRVRPSVRSFRVVSSTFWSRSSRARASRLALFSDSRGVRFASRRLMMAVSLADGRSCFCSVVIVFVLMFLCARASSLQFYVDDFGILFVIW